MVIFHSYVSLPEGMPYMEHLGLRSGLSLATTKDTTQDYTEAGYLHVHIKMALLYGC